MTQKNRKTQCSQAVKAQMNAFDTDLGFDSSFDFIDIPEKGESGFSAAKKLVQDLSKLGYEDIDIVIQLHENFSSTIAQKVLTECKKRGII